MMWRRVTTYLGREERDARIVVGGQLHAKCIVRNHRARPREEVKKEVGDRKPRGEAAARVGAHRRRGRGDVVRGQRAVGNHEFEAGSEGGARGVARAAQALELAARHGGGVRREDAPGEGEGHHQEEHRDDAERESTHDPRLSPSPFRRRVIRGGANDKTEEEVDRLAEGDGHRVREDRVVEAFDVHRRARRPHRQIEAGDWQPEATISGHRRAL